MDDILDRNGGEPAAARQSGQAGGSVPGAAQAGRACGAEPRAAEEDPEHADGGGDARARRHRGQLAAAHQQRGQRLLLPRHDGRMLLRDRERWWALVDLVIKYRVGLEEEDWLTALGVQPDDPNSPFRLLLEHILPPYCQHMYAKDHCVDDLVALTNSECAILRAVSLLSLGYSANPYDRRIKKVLLFHAKTSEELAEAAARHKAATKAKADAAAAAAAAEGGGAEGEAAGVEKQGEDTVVNEWA
eukprot:CAMPEP_0177721562 /NCGR_PEP_ID=MMETSP0484_2-20121128/17215_1 /TAXON_ID=354590 /ORGANISM="Rhodomonas lens, Strain RHODO" /LENGTH=244 /DNA_ID=CAMNT_0019233879 /DNA_START=136 /DNA_END=867 /DNA_ORIENTATION=+